MKNFAHHEIVTTRKHRDLLGIRFGIWLFVSGLLLLGGFSIWLSDVEHRRVADAGPEPGKFTPQLEITKSKMNSWRGVHTLSASESAHPNDAGAPPLLTVEAATKLACEKANQRAKELYDCEPFANTPPAQFVGGRYVWSVRQSHGHGDIEAAVDFASDGSVKNVQVGLMFDSPNLFF